MRERKNLSFLLLSFCCLFSAWKILLAHWIFQALDKQQKLNRNKIFFSHFSLFLTIYLLSFCGLTNGISPKICILCVRVKINKHSFEPFCVRILFQNANSHSVSSCCFFLLLFSFFLEEEIQRGSGLNLPWGLLWYWMMVSSHSLPTTTDTRGLRSKIKLTWHGF